MGPLYLYIILSARKLTLNVEKVDEVDLREVAVRTNGYSGADLKVLCLF